MVSHKGKKHTHCVDCGEPSTSDEPLSVRGLHERCALARMTKSAVQLQARRGPYYEQWRRSMRDASRRLVELYGE